LALEEAFLGATGKTPTSDPSRFEGLVKGMVSGVLTGGATGDAWINFLTRSTDPGDPIIFSEARGTDPIDAPRQHLQVISRAALLLRVAAAANSQLLRAGNSAAEDLKFWWSALGEERGLWAETQPPILTDLWADVDAAVRGIREWMSDTSSAERTFFKWRQDKSYDIAVLGGCERIALWSLSG